MRLRAIVLVTVGVCWLAADGYMIAGGVILRETRLGFISSFLDKVLPLPIHDTVFTLLGWITLFGWLVPLILRFRFCLRLKRAS